MPLQPRFTEDRKIKLENRIREAVQKFNIQNWIRYEIGSYSVNYEHGDIGEATGIWRYAEGDMVFVTIVGLRDKFTGKEVSTGSLGDNDKACAGYLSLLLDSDDPTHYVGEGIEFAVKVSPKFFIEQ